MLTLTALIYIYLCIYITFYEIKVIQLLEKHHAFSSMSLKKYWSCTFTKKSIQFLWIVCNINVISKKNNVQLLKYCKINIPFYFEKFSSPIYNIFETLIYIFFSNCKKIYNFEFILVKFYIFSHNLNTFFKFIFMFFFFYNIPL